MGLQQAGAVLIVLWSTKASAMASTGAVPESTVGGGG